MEGIMMSLDDKLALILEDLTEYNRDPARYSRPMKAGEQTFIEQIKQAFTEAGWHVEKTGNGGCIVVNAVGDYEYAKQGMSGQEWLDRFEKAIIAMNGNGKLNVIDSMYTALAKKASGIE
jgi:hypothetical protein